MDSWLIVGLGNPGLQYEFTRHNAGFMLIDRLAQKLAMQVKREECRALVGQTKFENKKLELVKPQTYMNLSGESVSCLLKKGDRNISGLIVAVDDLALPLGSIRIRASGSAGGHNGLKSLISCLGTNVFTRLRIGIQPQHELRNSKKFVLDKFSSAELRELDSVLERATVATEVLIRHGIAKAMSEYN
ncbi:MAG: aminoacyl-tRNA hydrolase [Pyrinomonadaceae bacterium]